MRSTPFAAAALVFTVMLGLSFWLFAAVWHAPTRLAYGGQDAVLFDWFLAWTPHALGNGINPFYTHAIGPPAGVNLMWNTPAPLLGALAAPLTVLAGPLVSYDFWVTVAPAASGLACYLTLRRWVRFWPAFIGGLLYGFSPVVMGAAGGHINLEFAVYPPLALALLDDILVRQKHPRRSGVLLGVASAAQLLISSEVLLTTALIGVAGVVLLVLLARDPLPRQRLGMAAGGLGLATASAAPLMAAPLAVQFLGAQRPAGPLQQLNVSVSDLLTPVLPTPFQRLSTGSLRRIVHHFTASPVEVGGYLGIPLLLALAAIIIWRRRDLLVRWAALTGLVTALLAFGPRLHVNGHVTAIPLPWAALQRLPVLQNVLPSRLAVFVVLMAALLLARGLDTLPRRWLPATATGTAIALAPLIPLVPYQPTPVTVPSFFTTPAVQAIPRNGLVLAMPLPSPRQPQVMAWAAAAGVRFRLVSCYCIVPGADGKRAFYPPYGPLLHLIQHIANTGGPLPSQVPAQVAADFASLAPSAVLLGPALHQSQLETFVDRLVGTWPRRVGSVLLWLVHRPNRS